MELNFDFFKVINDKKAAKGRILISEPFLSDSYFKRSVVFLTEHNEEGTVGFVLNKPIDMRIEDVMQDFPSIDSGISVGGPVNTNTVHYIHTLGEKLPDSVHVKSNIWWGGNFDALKEMIIAGQVKGHELRFFLGYSGWSPNQLEDEIHQNAWLVGEIPPQMIMTGIKNDFWNEVLLKMQNKYQVWANFPENPGLN
jgi:putative transcriptional regulator